MPWRELELAPRSSLAAAGAGSAEGLAGVEAAGGAGGRWGMAGAVIAAAAWAGPLRARDGRQARPAEGSPNMPARLPVAGRRTAGVARVALVAAWLPGVNTRAVLRRVAAGAVVGRWLGWRERQRGANGGNAQLGAGAGPGVSGARAGGGVAAWRRQLERRVLLGVAGGGGHLHTRQRLQPARSQPCSPRSAARLPRRPGSPRSRVFSLPGG